MRPVAVGTSKNETAETRSHTDLSRRSAGSQHGDEEQTRMFVCCLATTNSGHMPLATAVGWLPSLDQEIPTAETTTLSRSSGGTAWLQVRTVPQNPNQQTCGVASAGTPGSACANGLSAVSLVPAWMWAPHTAVHINLPVKRLCLVASPPLF